MKIKVGTAGYYKMRGLLFPGMKDETPDETELWVEINAVKKTIKKYLNLWNMELELAPLDPEEITSLMEIVTNIIIVSNNVKNQEIWFKNKIKKFDDKSLYELLLDSQFDKALSYTRAAINVW